MKKYILVTVMLFLFPILFVNANSISSIDIDVYIDNYGNANIIETWNAYLDEGTEGYHPYYNLGKSTISDLSVSMNGKKFTTINNWDINKTKTEKAYKAGIYVASNEEVDICFGISEYGNNTYKISYSINNFVAKTTDYDMVYWNLFPHNFSEEPDNVTVTIHSDFLYKENDIKFYGYGKYGALNQLKNGKLYIDSKGSVDSDEYITILMRFPKDTFANDYYLDNNFEYYYNMAEKGAINYNDKDASLISRVLKILKEIIVFIIRLLPFIALGLSILYTSSKKPRCRFGIVGNRVRKDVPNFRDIPCNKDIFRAYWVAVNYGLLKNKTDFLGAILLKWLKNGNVRIEKIEKDGLFKDKVINNIIFDKKPVEETKLESDLFDWMHEASIDGKLEENEFKKWCSTNYKKILDWFDRVLELQNGILVNEGNAKVTKEKKFKFLTYTYYDIDSKMMQEAEQMAGLKKFLEEFSRIKEKQPIEVKLWNEYLIYAQIFGIADKVASQFKKLYPEIITDMNTNGYDYSDIVFIRAISYSGINSANAASSSSHSSGGGGGGSFGSGGGGGGFR